MTMTMMMVMVMMMLDPLAARLLQLICYHITDVHSSLLTGCRRLSLVVVPSSSARSLLQRCFQIWWQALSLS